MKKCELCNSPARMYCESDQASLCWICDSRVHSANFLVAKHSRTLLCNLCQSFTPWTASGPKLTPTASVCNNCVANSTCREEIRNGGDDDDDRNDRGDDSDDDDDDDDDDDTDGGENGGGGGDDDDDEENQVVPWSSTPPPAATSSSNSDLEGYSNNSDEDLSLAKIAFSFKTTSSVSQSVSRPMKKNQKKGLQMREQLEW